MTSLDDIKRLNKMFDRDITLCRVGVKATPHEKNQLGRIWKVQFGSFTVYMTSKRLLESLESRGLFL